MRRPLGRILPLILLPITVLALSGCGTEDPDTGFGQGNGTEIPGPNTATPGSSTASPGTATPQPSATDSPGSETSTQSPTPSQITGANGSTTYPNVISNGVTVVSDLGSIEVNGQVLTAGATVRYDYTTTGELNDDELDQLQVLTLINGEALSVAAIIPSALRDDVVDLSLGVDVPPANPFTITSDGTTNLVGLTAGGTVVNGSGAVWGLDLDGTLTIQNDVGETDIQTSLSGNERVSIVGGEGNITLRIPQGVGAAVNAETGNGDIIFTDITFNGTNFDGLAAGSIGLGSAVISISTNSGDIEIIGE